MNMFYITVPPSECVSRPINFCSSITECIAGILLTDKMVVSDFHMFPVAPVATTIIFPSLSLLLLLPPPPPLPLLILPSSSSSLFDHALAHF